MQESNLSDITFDDQDANLFQVDDLRLRADAITHSILPRLHILLNKTISKIRSIYNIDVLTDSTITSSPHFRSIRDNELNIEYRSANVGLMSKLNGIQNRFTPATY